MVLTNFLASYYTLYRVLNMSSIEFMSILDLKEFRVLAVTT